MEVVVVADVNEEAAIILAKETDELEYVQRRTKRWE
jgi:hypothetical protein